MRMRDLRFLGGLCALIAVTMLLNRGNVAQAQLKLEWGVEGYYRTRGVWLTNLASEPRYQVQHPVLDVPITMPEIRDTSYLVQRVRISPHVSLESIARLNLELTGFDNVVWGDNNAISSAPLFAVNGSNQSYLGGGEQPSLQLTRAWIEFMIPIGLIRVGRMPSHWGLGILANGGGSGNWDPTTPVGKPRRHVQDYYFDDDFGDNNFGSTNDRFLFATRPLKIIKTIMKSPDVESNVIFAYCFDKLSEAPLLLDEEDRTYRPFQQQGFLSRGAKQDDVNEHVFLLAYSNPDWDQVRITDELKFGTYWALRFADEGFTAPSQGLPTCPDGKDCVTHDEGSFVYIADFWYRIKLGIPNTTGSVYSEFEGVHIGGQTTGGVPFPGKNIRKDASINGGVLRAGWLDDNWDGVLELGYASGDEDLGDGTFKQRALHPDYNMGLILYDEIIRERSARVFGPQFISSTLPDGAKGFMTSGGVFNSKYIAPKARYRLPQFGLELVGQVLFAWIDKMGTAPPNVFVCPITSTNPDGSCSMSKYLGTEVDLAVKARFAKDTMDVSLETGYLWFGDILKTTSLGAENPHAADGAFTLQARVAFVF
jgi:hypothetical protein